MRRLADTLYIRSRAGLSHSPRPRRAFGRGLHAVRKLLHDPLDVAERRKTGLVAEMLDLERRGGRGEAEMLLPALVLVLEIRIHVGAVENVAHAAGVAHTRVRHRQRRKPLHRAALVVPEKAQLA